MRAPIALALLPLLAAARTAAAQTFPADADWTPLACRDLPATDVLGDEPSAVRERDLVGDTDEPVALRAVDEDYFYLRIRLDAEPEDPAAAEPSAWGIAFDLDLDGRSYELLLVADGETDEIRLYENTDPIFDDPTDPADLPPLASVPFDTSVQIDIAGSAFGGDDDWFLDLAMPWAELEPAGLTPDTPFYAWVASSTAPDRLDADFACHDGTGGGIPAVDDIASDESTADPDVDPDPDPGVPGERQLEGGGGCQTGAPGHPLTLLALTLTLLAIRAARASLLARRANRRSSMPTRRAPHS